MPIDKPKTPSAVLLTPLGSMPGWGHSLTKRIPLHGKHGEGHFALVDDDDHERLSGYNWLGQYGGKGGPMYVIRTVRPTGKNTGSRSISLHREVMGVLGAGKSVQVDHINGDPLDNRKANLRVCTGSENRKNQHARYGSSRHKGVYARGRRWIAQIHVNGYPEYLGSYGTEDEAGRAYDAAAVRFFGEFANLNFPEEAA